MDWGKVFFVFFSLMSLTFTLGFLYESNIVILFIATAINFIATTFRIGVKNSLSAELFASSLVADFHLIPAFVFLQVFGDIEIATALVVGAVVANLFSVVLLCIGGAKARESDY
ncbi:hypothetical protein LS66_005110 [Helicobacter sp. MIT 03-1614]|jgi:hypothetical protein|uniref:Integral membrane protein n=1 Tax=Helicobacter hepaticus (strain ATCC 51449 / 3B1) TaxID=235279 RepID=Q7VFM6_HELHP|nr:MULTISPECIES: DUF6394 family protein [Helicobacter]AAP78246.1 conserved hypothetical protein [Helicobacter hepaticus ATCC 51449]TLD88911.1 hypothetical protein LS66_005110 [Helicobacter sp. MIT 03-1614]